MAFGSPQYREDHHGRWWLYRYDDMPVAQLFFPSGWKPDRAFSFFWLGTAQVRDVHELVAKLVDPARSHVSGRFVGPVGVNTFTFGTAGERKDAWDVYALHHIVEAALLPATLGMTIETRAQPSLPAQVYLWAAVEPSRQLLDEPSSFPEIGVKTRLDDWLKPRLGDAIRPLLQQRSRMKTGESEMAWLWQQVAETAQRYSV